MIPEEEGQATDAPEGGHPVEAKPAEAAGRTQGPLRWAIPLLVAVVLGYPLVRWVVNRNQNPPAPATAGPAPAAPAAGTPQYYVNLSVQHYQAGRFQECIDAAKRAVELKPDSADAFNNMAACFGSLGRFDEEIQSAQEALRIDPTHGLARNNLVWALQQKKLRETGPSPKK